MKLLDGLMKGWMGVLRRSARPPSKRKGKAPRGDCLALSRSSWPYHFRETSPFPARKMTDLCYTPSMSTNN